ncbi:MAG: molybdopterin-dependent oxidoreductase, partial [Cyclobacteriaceae bacterium]|nr:molybdopterin-dependent oxidoreductase [Cyclobacteriaceae bacterium]
MAQISRRKFIELSSLTGSALVLGFIPGESKDAMVVKANHALSNIDLNQFISISSDGHIVLFNHRPEMGQGTFQSIPMILAEELEVDIHKVEIRQSPADQDLYGRQMVVGSRSIQTEFEKLRMMGASAREMLKQAAAEQWNISSSLCQAKDGRIIGPNDQSLTYGDLVAAASKLPVPKNPSLKSPDQFKIIGTSVARQDIPLKTNGQAKFGMDLQVPGMLYATIVHCPQFLGTARSYNRDEVL